MTPLLHPHDVGHLRPQEFHTWHESLFGYQRRCWEAKHDPVLSRTRNVLKSHQVGMSWYVAGEALEDAALTGDNQIFIAQSRGMAKVYCTYVRQIAEVFLGLSLAEENPIVLSNGAELHFFDASTDSPVNKVGHVYVDEYCWAQDLGYLIYLADNMAMHPRWRQTYLSTLSHHLAPWQFWSGALWRAQDAARAGVTFPGDAALREGGCLCPDGQWRYLIPLDDAVAQGCHLLDADALKEEYPDEVFAMIYLCQFPRSEFHATAPHTTR